MAPRVVDSELYRLLREGNIEGFNARRAVGADLDLRDADLRGADLRGMDAAGLDMRGAYLRGADLRGIDFRETRLEGASINGAKISGAYFPTTLPAEEINLSLLHGTRMRYREPDGRFEALSSDIA